MNGWVAGIASHGSVLLSMGWLVTVRPLDIPGTHLPLSSMQLLTQTKETLKFGIKQVDKGLKKFTFHCKEIMNMTFCSDKDLKFETSALPPLHRGDSTLVTLFDIKFWCHNN